MKPEKSENLSPGGGRPENGAGPSPEEKERAEKMRRFAQVMREKFGVKWDEPEEGVWSAPASPGEEKKANETPAPTRTMELTTPNKRENEFIMNGMVLVHALGSLAPAVRERARRAGPTVWRDIRMMDVTLVRVMNALMETIPEKRRDYYIQTARHGRYEFKINGPIETDRIVAVSVRKLLEVYEVAMQSECLTCMRDGNEIRNCPLRACFLETIPPKKVAEDGRWMKCEYEEVARQMIRGEEISL